MRRKPVYRWRLRDLMAAHEMYATTDLVPLLAERGVDLSPSQVHRLVTQVPERLNLQILACLCDIFGCSPADLIVTDVEVVADRKASGGSSVSGTGTVVDLARTGRPRRARVRRNG